MMSGGVMTYRVIGTKSSELYERLLDALYTHNAIPATFDAKYMYDASEKAAMLHFEVTVDQIYTRSKPVFADVVDQEGRWFRIILPIEDEKPIEFKIITQI